MKKLIVLFLLFASELSRADELKIEVSPQKPVVGEVFQAYFRIFSDSGEAPEVSFTPYNLEVVNKANQGVSTRTVYSNGRLSVTREMTVVYELVAKKDGLAQLRSIQVQLGGKTLKHGAVNINILKEAEVLPDVFVQAQVPKKSVFLGEGIIVRYYLYSKVPVSNLDVKKYPKLNHFLKRFLQETERSERVTVDGHLYLRTQIYAAKLFPEKLGDLKIDPLQLTATFANSRTNDPFGAFGYSRDFRTKTLTSEPVKIEVRPLPLPVPKHFTGLVGPHQFEVQFGPTRLIVNEPLEVKFTVSGGGALENLEAPQLLSHQGLEEFETNGELKISGPDEATKIFDYTYLAQENLSLPATKITVSYFNSETETYVPTTLEIPAIVVAGGAATEKPKNPSGLQRPGATASPSSGEATAANQKLSAPAFEANSLLGWVPYLNVALAGIALLLALGWFVGHPSRSRREKPYGVPKQFRQGQFELGAFLQWIAPMIQRTGKSPVTLIREAELKDDTKRYFIDLLESNDYKNYSASPSPFRFKYQSSYFKELGKYIERVRNEDPNKSLRS